MRKVLLTLTVLLVAACGGGGGSSNSNLTGQFIDAPVEGLYFVSSTGVTGTTDASGTFQFKAGDTVTFKIGGANGLELAAVTPTPAANSQIKVADLPASSQIAQVLQTFGCPSGQDCSETKLDLRSITFTDDQKTTLKDHFDSRGDLDTFATSAASLVAAVGTAAGKTFAPKTKADVIAHIAKADVKNPTTSFPSFKEAIVVEEKYISFIGLDKAKNFVGLIDPYLTEINGTFKQTSGKLIDINWTNYKPRYTALGKPNTETFTAEVGCSDSFEFMSMLKDDILFPYGFNTRVKSTAQCDDSAKDRLAKFIPIDDSFLLADLDGKRLSIKGAKNKLGVACNFPIAFDVAKGMKERELVISPALIDEPIHPCGDLNNYNLGVGETLENTLKITSIVPAMGTIVTMTSSAKELGADASELLWIFKTKGLNPKLVIIYGGNVKFDTNNVASFMDKKEIFIQSLQTVDFTITDIQPISMNR